MTRKKKTRRVGSEGPAQYVDKNQNEQDRIARMLKKQKKRKGKKAGSRHSEEDNKQVRRSGGKQDPRIGSKKPIPLGTDAEKPKQPKLTPEQELAKLEQDPQLNVLLDRIENGEKLGAGLQAYVDEKLDRIEVLMDKLGLLTDDNELNDDDDLLAKFEQQDD
ncbi:Der GTPase-activating protein YihI [Salinivibrio kushneri]|uniref:Der GTPase-activating protein YihI n=1 Tax=Salinivibrio kushneri TaxID=1908198 RepID=UPI0022B51B6E|nr:Der GTPase-activating protein YihI [Salinivibrio kushneri]WBA17830.1 Der GTPase-activating protein YihI [Salinivibrio kushneri]